MKKIIVSGISAGVAMVVVMFLMGMVVQALFPALQSEYQNTNLFRSWSDPLMSLMYVEPIILGLVLAWIWDKVKGVVKGATAAQKAWNFGLVYWVLAIPGMVMSWASFPISLTMVFTWWVSILAQAFVGAWILAKLNK